MINYKHSIKKEFDIIVVGAGLAGCSTAYYLTKGGMKVALLELREVCSGASGRMGGQVLELEPATSEAAAGGKYTLSDEVIRKKSRVALGGKALLSSLSEELGLDVEYVKNGSVVIAYSKEEADEIKKGVEHQNEVYKTDIVFLSPSRVRKLYPVFGNNIYGARYSKTDGNANPFRIAYGFAYGAQKIGLEIFTYTPVKSLIFKNDKVTGVKTNKGAFYARFGVVIALSSWTKNILPEYPILPWKHLGFVTEQLPILPVPATDIYYGIADGKIVDSHSQKKGSMPFRVYSGSQKDGNIVIGGDPVRLLKMEDHLTEDVHLEDFIRYGAVFNKFWVKAKSASLIRAWAGALPFTPDGMPLVGSTKYKNLYMNSGNVNGCVFCPITGKLIAEYILNNGKTSIPIDFLNPERFEGDKFEWPEKYDYNTLVDYLSKK
ncbi:4-methylaminobutanoate oxidase (formaldehyde-forming) [subsurface metagenome]